jgi:hypothetical protein
VSHISERKEKDCLNCGTIIHGRYCHVCGQENLEPKESFWHLLTHFFNDITHFDGKFFTSLKDLVLKPGFLSGEYMRGRRASYLNPVRMYVFTSAIFFLLFFSFFYSDDAGPLKINGKTLTEVAGMDSAEFAGFTANINKEDDKPAVPMTRKQFQDYVDTLTFSSGIHFKDVNFRSRAAYDSARASGARKDNWISRQVIYKVFAINEKYHGNAAEIFTALRSALVHSLPQMLFISLPLMALLLKLFYIRRKQFYYVSHGIFSLHFYIFVFITMLFLFCIGRLNSYLQWSALSFILD